jgi:hypothetical protein
MVTDSYSKHYQKQFYHLNQKQFFMKQFIVIFCLGVALASCNNAATDKKESGTTAVKSESATGVKLPFPLMTPYKNWQTGSNENVVAAMGALKAFVDSDFTGLAALTGDTLDVRFDYYHAKLTRDSAIKMFINQRTMYKDLTITMYDYESVISEDKKDEYVTLWYKQAWKNDKGVADSLGIIDDCKMKNGKMIELDEKIQHYPAKK